jgi:hypothetical protein
VAVVEGPEAGHVGRQGDGGQEREQAHAHPAGDGDGHREGGPGDPGQLEPGLEAGEVRPRTASGASRWTMLSKASLAAPAARPTAKASTANPARPPIQAERRPTATTMAREPCRMRSSAVRSRSLGATAAPRNDPTMLVARTTPNHHAGASSLRRLKATRKVRNPTTARSTPMAVAAMRTDAACSSASAAAGMAMRSAPRGGRVSRNPAMAVAAKVRAARRTTQGAPRVLRTMIPGTEAAKPASTDSTASRALAATSSPSVATVLGTRALLVTMWALDSTRTANASGKSISPSRWPAIDRQTTARVAAPAITRARRPPRLRSMTGDSRGATTANGATVSSR